MSQPVRSPEHRHEKRCLANAIIRSVETLRDVPASVMTDFDFNIAAQDNDFLYEARAWLDDPANCTCGPCRCCEGGE